MNFITASTSPPDAAAGASGAAIALPVLDAMCPALAAPPIETGPPHRGRVCSERHRHERLEARGDRAGFRVHAHSEAAGAVPPGHHSGFGPGQSCARKRPRAAGMPRRPAVSFPARSRSTRRARMCGRELRSIRSRRNTAARRRAFRRCNSAVRIRAWWATAIPDRVAPIRTAFRGRTRKRRSPVEVNPRSVFERLFGDGRSQPSRRCPRAPRFVSQEHSGSDPRDTQQPDDRFGCAGPAQAR